MEKIQLSDGEWRIMNVLWNTTSRTLGQITKTLEPETGWSRPTVYVMLKRLISKGIVRLDDSTRIQSYHPLIERNDIILEVTESILDKVFDGSVSLMVSALTDCRKLSEDEIRKIRKILDEAEKGREE